MFAVEAAAAAVACDAAADAAAVEVAEEVADVVGVVAGEVVVAEAELWLATAPEEMVVGVVAAAVVDLDAAWAMVMKPVIPVTPATLSTPVMPRAPLAGCLLLGRRTAGRGWAGRLFSIGRMGSMKTRMHPRSQERLRATLDRAGYPAQP